MLSKIALIFGLLVCLEGCGFQPLYCGDPDQQQQVVLHFKGEGATGYKFRRELEKHLSIMPQFDDNRYRLDVTLEEVKKPTIYAEDATISQVEFNLVATYTIKLGDHIVGTNTNSMATSYPVLPTDEFISKNAELASENRTAITLAEEVARDIIRLLHQPRQQIG